MKPFSFLSFCILLLVVRFISGCQPVNHRIVIRNQSAVEALILVSGGSPEEYPAKDSVLLPMEAGFRKIGGGKGGDQLRDSVFAVTANDSFQIRVPPHSMVELTPMIRYYAAFTGKVIVVRHARQEYRVYTDYPFRTRKSFKKGFRHSAPVVDFNAAGGFLYCDLRD